MTEHEQETRRWLQFAHRDSSSAYSLLSDGDFSNACYLSQQAAEKALKAIYVFVQVEYPYIHDLDVLRNGLPKGWSIASHYSSLKNLTQWATAARYPNELPDATKDDATVAVAIAQDVFDSVVASLTVHGYTP